MHESVFKVLRFFHSPLPSHPAMARRPVRPLGMLAWLGFCLLMVGPPTLAEGRGLDEATTEKAAALLKDGAYDEAVDLLDEGPIRSGRHLLLLVRGLLGQDDWKTAIEKSQKAIRQLADDADAQLAVAEALRDKMAKVQPVRAMMSLKPYRKALARALVLDPEHVGALTEEIGFLTYAPKIAGGDKEAARKRIQELEALDLRKGLQMRSSLARAEKDWEAWHGALEKLAALDPKDEDTQLQLARSRLSLRRYQDALPLLDQLTQSEERRIALAALYLRADTRVLADGEIRQAVAEYDQYLEAVGEDPGERGLPTVAWVYWRRGKALEKAGDRQGARTSWNEALRRNPDLKQARQALKKLD